MEVTVLSGPLDPSESGSIPAPGDIPFARVVTAPAVIPPPPDAEPILLLNSTRGGMVLDIAFVIALLILFELLVWFVIRLVLSLPLAFSGELDPELVKSLRVPQIVAYTLGSVLIVALILNLRRQPSRSVGLTKERFWLNLLLGLAAVCVAYATIVPTVFVLSHAMPSLFTQLQENTGRLMELFPRLHPLAFVPVMFCVGLWEELVFRGFLMTRLRRLTGSWVVAIILSSAAFTSLHYLDQTIAALVPVAILSLIFSVVTIWRRSIIPAIVGHAVFNLSQVIGLYYMAGDQWT
jgi:membrane protease YdiL (CAAX protease family)